MAFCGCDLDYFVCSYLCLAVIFPLVLKKFRVLLRKRLKESPSLKANLAEIYEETLSESKRSLSKLFDLPEQIELTLTQVLDEDWFPD